MNNVSNVSCVDTTAKTFHVFRKNIFRCCARETGLVCSGHSYFIPMKTHATETYSHANKGWA